MSNHVLNGTVLQVITPALRVNFVERPRNVRIHRCYFYLKHISAISIWDAKKSHFLIFSHSNTIHLAHQLKTSNKKYLNGVCRNLWDPPTLCGWYFSLSCYSSPLLLTSKRYFRSHDCDSRRDCTFCDHFALIYLPASVKIGSLSSSVAHCFSSLLRFLWTCRQFSGSLPFCTLQILAPAYSQIYLLFWNRMTKLNCQFLSGQLKKLTIFCPNNILPQLCAQLLLGSKLMGRLSGFFLCSMLSTTPFILFNWWLSCRFSRTAI